MAIKSKVHDDCELEMTPMIDVTFLLLIFFMCTMKFKQIEGMVDANLPTDEGPSSQHMDKKEIPTIKIFIDPASHNLGTYGQALTDTCPIKAKMSEDAICANVTLTIGEKHGQVHVLNFAAMNNELRQRMSAIPAGAEPPAIEIRCRKYLPFYFVAQTLNVCKLLKLKNIKFTMPEIDRTGQEPIIW